MSLYFHIVLFDSGSVNVDAQLKHFHIRHLVDHVFIQHDEDIQLFERHVVIDKTLQIGHLSDFGLSDSKKYLLSEDCLVKKDVAERVGMKVKKYFEKEENFYVRNLDGLWEFMGRDNDFVLIEQSS